MEGEVERWADLEHEVEFFMAAKRVDADRQNS